MRCCMRRMRYVCAFWETLCRNRFARRRRRELPRVEVEFRLVVSIGSTGTLSLIDLRGDGPVRLGAPSAVAHDGNHVAGRALSATVHAGVPEADGFLFASRFTGDTCVAVFDRAFGKLMLLGIDELVRHAGFLDALDDYDIVLTEPAGVVEDGNEHGDCWNFLGNGEDSAAGTATGEAGPRGSGLRGFQAASVDASETRLRHGWKRHPQPRRSA